MKNILTYGTFDLLHYGHIKLLQRARQMGTSLIVGLSTDEFNRSKGKCAYFDYPERKLMLEAVRYVDLVIPEYCWEQKIEDIKAHNIDTFVIGDDWRGKFDHLLLSCNVVYIPRTKEISTSIIRGDLKDR